MPRDREELELEALYLRELNAGLRDLLEHVSAVAHELAGVPVALLELVTQPPGRASVESITGHVHRGLERLATLQREAIALGELVGGRIIVVTREAGLEPDADA